MNADKRKKASLALQDITKSLTVNSTEDFIEIEKNVHSMKKIFEKLESDYFTSFSTFATVEAKC